MYVAVFYSVTNETQGALRPDSHINGAFSLADEAGRQWTAANFGSHSFAVAAAFALQAGLADPRDWVEAGDTATTAIAFDVPVDATGIRLRSELLGVAVSISEAGNVVLAAAQPTAAPAPAATAAPTAAPTAAAAEPTATAPSAVAPKRASDLPIDGQKKALVAIVNERLAGLSNEELPRLKLPPDARDHRQGGIWVTIEFNGDEYETIPISKGHLDIMMRDTYETLFTAGYVLRQEPIQVFKTKDEA
jgi:hypothetical protein